MNKSAYYSDLIFTFFVLSFCSLFILRYFKIPLIFASILSVAFGFAGSYLLSLFLKRKQRLFALKKSEENEKNTLFFYLALSSKEELLNFLKPRLPFIFSVLNSPGDIQLQHEINEREDVLSLQGFTFFPRFQFDTLTRDDVARLYPKLKSETSPVILFDKANDDALSLAKTLGVQTIDGNRLYRAFKENDAIPNDFPIKSATPVKKKRRNLAFAKSNSRRYFTSGAMLLVSSTFIPYPVYYLIGGAILLTTALFVRIFGYQ